MSTKEKIVTAILMSLIMAFALSGFFVVNKIGFVPGWHNIWFSGFTSAWPIALVLALLIGKPVNLVAVLIAKKLP